MKKQQEMHETDSIPWKPIKDYPGAYEKILNYDPETGSVTRLFKYDGGTVTQGTLSHDFIEEAYILDGSLIDLSTNLEIKPGYYGYRHPGMKHGPYSCPNGVLSLEIRNYEK